MFELVEAIVSRLLPTVSADVAAGNVVLAARTWAGRCHANARDKHGPPVTKCLTVTQRIQLSHRVSGRHAGCLAVTQGVRPSRRRSDRHAEGPTVTQRVSARHKLSGRHTKGPTVTQIVQPSHKGSNRHEDGARSHKGSDCHTKVPTVTGQPGMPYTVENQDER